MRYIILLPALLLGTSATVLAQSNYAAVRGSVTDSQQHAIPRARVRITSLLTGAAREVFTDSAGLYAA